LALKPIRVEECLAWTHPRYQPSEHGGLVSFVEMSGMPFSTYAADPSGIQMIGVQRHDVYDFDDSQHQRYPRGRIVHDIFDDQIRIIVRGEITTNFIHPDSANNIASSIIAYAGPSGLFTHDSSFSGDIVGMFLSEISGGEQSVMVEGDVFNYPRKSVTTPGYAKVRLKFYGSPGSI